jgi:nucleoside-diphosphate-sugar epimerase
MSKILVTGATGFIGQHLCRYLLKSKKYYVVGSVRSLKLNLEKTDVKYISLGQISSKTNWKDALLGVNCVIHCAGKAHAMNETITDKLSIYRSINVDATKKLAEEAAKYKVKRLIFLSSIKVYGECTQDINIYDSKNFKKKIFTYKDLPEPQDIYARTKIEAERVLWDISSRTGLEVVVLRVPLVYGYGVKGNLERLIKIVKSGIPLPLSKINNERSMIGIDNLVDLITKCIDHVDAAGKTFLVSDGKDLSTPSLVNLIASSMGHKKNLFPMPIILLKFIFFIFGKKEEINRLIGSLKIDIDYTKETLNWIPPLGVEEGIKKMVQGNDKDF